jgi:hypothetical protein
MEERAVRIGGVLKNRISAIRELHEKALELTVDDRVRRILSGVNVKENAFPTRRDKALITSILHINQGGSDSLPTRCLRCGGVSSRVLSVLAGFSCCNSCGSLFVGSVGICGSTPLDEKGKDFDSSPLIFVDPEVESLRENIRGVEMQDD